MQPQRHGRDDSKQLYLHCVEAHKVMQPLVPDHCQKQHKKNDEGTKLAAEVDAGKGPCTAQQQDVSRSWVWNVHNSAAAGGKGTNLQRSQSALLPDSTVRQL